MTDLPQISTASFEQAILSSFPLQTAVAALHIFLDISAPSPTRDPTLKEENVLIWGAGGAVG
jgi:NADPH:quinone reductase-like Zn-dependent oxidoreductase